MLEPTTKGIGILLIIILTHKANLFLTPHKGPHLLSANLHLEFLICYGYINVFRAALHMVISDFFHLRLGASVGVISNIATASRCLIVVFIALGLIHRLLGEEGQQASS